MGILEGLSRIEMRIFSLALVGLGICGLLLSSDPVNERLFIKSAESDFESQLSSGSESKTFLDVPLLIEGDPLQIYVWKMEDFYRQEGDLLQPRKDPPMEVSADRKLVWTHESSGPFLVQISPDNEFSKSREFISSPKLVLELNKLRVGETFWRVSADGKRWSDAKTFKIEAKFLGSSPRVRVINLGSQSVDLFLSTNGKELSHLVELSQDEEFSVDKTEVKMTEDNKIRFQLGSSGRYYVRVRAVNSMKDISETSPIISFSRR